MFVENQEEPDCNRAPKQVSDLHNNPNNPRVIIKKRGGLYRSIYSAVGNRTNFITIRRSIKVGRKRGRKKEMKKKERMKEKKKDKRVIIEKRGGGSKSMYSEVTNRTNFIAIKETKVIITGRKKGRKIGR